MVVDICALLKYNIVMMAIEWCIDLHIHSICLVLSDSIFELLNNLKVNKVTKIALTNHDTTEGCR